MRRRNVNTLNRLYIIGRRYLLEKNEHGGDRKSIPQNEGLISETAERIAKAAGVGHATVERAAKITETIDIITANTGISRAEILSGRIDGNQTEIKELAAKDAAYQKRIVDLILNEGELNLKLAFTTLWEEQ